MLQGLIEYAASSDFEAWVREAVAAEDAGREEAPEVKTLEAEAKAQATKVERAGRALIDQGRSEFLSAALRQEENRLRALRKRLAEVRRKQPPPGPPLDLGRVLAAMRDVAEVARSDPGAVRSALAAVVESITFRPGADG